MNKVNTLVLCEEDYSSKEEWQQEIGKAAMLLSHAGYIMVAHLEETGIFRIDYEYVDKEYGCVYPYWLSPDEAARIIWDDDEESLVGAGYIAD